MDPLDAAATAQHPTVAPGNRSATGSRRVVRRRADPFSPLPSSRPQARLDAGSTSEVAVEDILLEVYAEEPPPPPSRRIAAPQHMPSHHPSSVSRIAHAIASVVPPPPAQSAAVDALLRASDPSLAAFSAPTRVPPQGQGFVHPQSSSFPAVGYSVQDPRAQAGSAGDWDAGSPSVAPVMLATVPPPGYGSPEYGPPLARPIIGAVPTRRTNRGAVLAIWAVVILVVGIGAGAGAVLGVSNGTFARLRDRAHAPRAAAASPASPTTAPVIRDTPVVAPAAPPIVPPAAPSPAPVPTVAIDALPKPAIAADMALVTLPKYAQGHRVFVDGRIVSVAADGSPTTIKCGRHMIKIGTARRPRVVDLACGAEVTLK